MRVSQWPAPKSPKVPRTIAELIEVLDSEEDADIEILPNGEIRRKGKAPRKVKPLTMREDLGGEYAA